MAMKQTALDDNVFVNRMKNEKSTNVGKISRSGPTNEKENDENEPTNTTSGANMMMRPGTKIKQGGGVGECLNSQRSDRLMKGP